MAPPLGQHAANWKRLSLGVVTDNPKTTTLYITQTAELRGDQDIYMFNIDRCYTKLEQANARVELLGHCNVSLRSVETKLSHNDESDCLTVTRGRYGSQVRFLAQVKNMEMPGMVMQKDPGETSPGGPEMESAIGLFFAETHLDLSSHIWAVAIHQPPRAVTDGLTPSRRLSGGRSTSMSARTQKSRAPSFDAKKALSPVAEDKPTQDVGNRLGWTIDSIHADSDRAIARAKKAWNEQFKEKGRCKKLREHYGFARYAFKPALTTKRSRDYDTCVQIRVERIRVVPVSERPEYVLAPVPEKGRVFVPPLRHVDGEVISTAAGCRTSFLDSLERIANNTLGASRNYKNLPLALKIRQEHNERWSALSEQRFGAVPEKEDSDTMADMYHAMLHGKGAIDLKGKVQRRGSTRSMANVKARARMAAALIEHDHEMQEEDDAIEPEQTKVTERVGMGKASPGTLQNCSLRMDSVVGLQHMPRKDSLHVRPQ